MPWKLLKSLNVNIKNEWRSVDSKADIVVETSCPNLRSKGFRIKIGKIDGKTILLKE